MSIPTVLVSRRTLILGSICVLVASGMFFFGGLKKNQRHESSMGVSMNAFKGIPKAARSDFFSQKKLETFSMTFF